MEEGDQHWYAVLGERTAIGLDNERMGDDTMYARRSGQLTSAALLTLALQFGGEGETGWRRTIAVGSGYC